MSCIYKYKFSIQLKKDSTVRWSAPELFTKAIYQPAQDHWPYNFLLFSTAMARDKKWPHLEEWKNIKKIMEWWELDHTMQQYGHKTEIFNHCSPLAHEQRWFFLPLNMFGCIFCPHAFQYAMFRRSGADMLYKWQVSVCNTIGELYVRSKAYRKHTFILHTLTLSVYYKSVLCWTSSSARIFHSTRVQLASVESAADWPMSAVHPPPPVILQLLVAERGGVYMREPISSRLHWSVKEATRIF